MNKAIAFVRNVWTTFRPHFFAVSGAAGLTGMVFAYQDPPVWKTATTFLICFFSYGLIQALCDTFDLETDRINAPFRPMVTGELPVKMMWVVLGSLLLAVGILFYFINPLMLAFQGAALVLSFTYNRMKRIPNAGPVWNGLIVAALPFLGALGVSDITTLNGFPREVIVFAFLVCFVYAGFVLTGYFKDVEGDAKTGYRTAPVYYGIDVAKWHVIPYIVVAVAGILFFLSDQVSVGSNEGSSTVFLVLSAAAVVTMVSSSFILIRNPSQHNSYKVLIWYTRGMVLYFLSPIAIVHSVGAVAASAGFLGLMEYFFSKTRGTYQA
ncbi:MAG: UbiA family prenyltransferase [Ignavibacteriales bacterium]|nr:UbiA family prenyltransferase [Ignavibacteriales bacterium]